jgi:hypothetical protein
MANIDKIIEKFGKNPTGELLESIIKEKPGCVVNEPVFTIILLAYRSADQSKWITFKQLLTKHRLYNDVTKAIKKEIDTAKKEDKVIYKPYIANEQMLAEMIRDGDNACYACYDIKTGEITAKEELVLDGAQIYRPPVDNDVFQKGYVILPTNIEEYGSISELYGYIIAFIHKYVQVSEEFEAIAAYYVMLTWVWDALPAIPILRAKGDWGTGKSRFLEVFGSICYRPIMTTGAITIAPVYRIMDMWRGTLVMDEGDIGDAEAAMTKILNCGFERNKPVFRCNPEDATKVDAFDPFCPKIIATRWDFTDKATESRCITEYTRESTRNDIVDTKLPEFEIEAKSIRNKLLLYRFYNYIKIKCVMEDINYKPKLELPGRLKQVAKPIAAIIGDDEVQLEKLRKFMEKRNEELILESSTTSEGHMVNILAGMEAVGDDDKICGNIDGQRRIVWNITYSKMVDKIKEANKDTNPNSKLTANSLSKKTRSLGFETIKHKNDKLIMCKEETFEQLKKRYVPGYVKPWKKEPENPTPETEQTDFSNHASSNSSQGATAQ